MNQDSKREIYKILNDEIDKYLKKNMSIKDIKRYFRKERPLSSIIKDIGYYGENLFDEEVEYRKFIRETIFDVLRDKEALKENKKHNMENKYIKTFENFQNESLIGFVLGGYFLIKFIKLLAKTVAEKGRTKYVNELLDKVRFSSAAKYKHKINDEFKEALAVNEFSDRYFIRSEGMFSFGDIRILKDPKMLIIGDSKIKLTDEEYNQFVEIIKKKL